MISFRARLIHAEHCAATRVRILRFALPEGDTVPAHQPGQYALLEFPGFSPRPYSIANVPNGHLLEFHIRISHSGASAYANKTLKIDDVITIYGFGGNCLFDSDCRSPILLVAGGTGLAPMMAIAETALSADPQR
ncbi:MAG: oxidoreductase, partial [Candidatus Omnitrophica bacterium]|nr:oxidoreductase [Candidatus Omnitrophota bacterium]